MTKPNLGLKRTCTACQAHFYDLGKNPAACPKCKTMNDINAVQKTRRGRKTSVEVAKDDPLLKAKAKAEAKKIKKPVKEIEDIDLDEFEDIETPDAEEEIEEIEEIEDIDDIDELEDASTKKDEEELSIEGDDDALIDTVDEDEEEEEDDDDAKAKRGKKKPAAAPKGKAKGKPAKAAASKLPAKSKKILPVAKKRR